MMQYFYYILAIAGEFGLYLIVKFSQSSRVVSEDPYYSGKWGGSPTRVTNLHCEHVCATRMRNIIHTWYRDPISPWIIPLPFPRK